ncbi:trinucleotide repeat-containing protein [Holotrichia oblita]|uniref:Trinucleotide repeat-containing protein n=1 Tax=Holotrichia oblita TaxID=644536 RepID=A0ACB9SPJ2_HOLOL|nr:trinucleotide repeat-containing protein [Holotrichia oblita]
MRVPVPSEPNLLLLSNTFPTYQVPQVSAMRGRAPSVQQVVARASWGGRADPPRSTLIINGGDPAASVAPPTTVVVVDDATLSVISGSSCLHPFINITTATTTIDNVITTTKNNATTTNSQQNVRTSTTATSKKTSFNDDDDEEEPDGGNSNNLITITAKNKNNNNNNVSNNLRMMQSVTDNCLLMSSNSTLTTKTTVTVPNKQRNKDVRQQQIVVGDDVSHNNINNNNDNDNINNNILSTIITNSDKLACKFGALKQILLFDGQDIPNQKADDLENFFDDNVDDNELMMNLTNTTYYSSGSTTDDDRRGSITTKTTTTKYLLVSDDYKTPFNCTTTTIIHNNNDNKQTTICNSDKMILYEKSTTAYDDYYDERTSRAYGPPLRLRGGGESSISTGTTGWGTPPSQQASNNNGNSTGWGSTNTSNQNSAGTQQWNNNSNRPPASGPGNSQDSNKANSNISQNGQQPPASQQSNNPGWGQPGTKQQPGGPPTSIANNSTSNTNANNTQGQSTTSTKQQLEQLTNMREAIFSHDGWGGQHVNQDTNWDIPGSPEPQMKMDGSGAPTWKPTVNNGTELWEANLRNGGQPPPQPQQKAPWGHTPSTNIGGTWGEDDDVTDSSNVWTGVPPAQPQWGSGNTGNGTAMWGGPKKENDWGTGAANTGWGDPRSADPRNTSIDPRDMRPDPTPHIRTPTTDPMRMLDPREQMRLVGGDMRGDPRGITGRLNGAGAEAFWGQAGPQAGAHHMHQPKMPMGPGNTTGWEEPSPPSQRRNMPNYDDGTSLWGNPQPGKSQITVLLFVIFTSKAGSHWKDLPTGASMGRNSAAGPPGMQSRMKPEASVWGHGRNGSWDDGGPGWDETGPWPKQKTMPGPIWDNDGDWIHKQGPKQPFTKEMIWNSKQFRVLVEMGYKKEDVENALRNREMNIEEAVDMLGSRNPNLVDSWRGRHEDHYEHQQFSGQRFPTGPTAQMNFPPGANVPNLLNNMNSSSAGANNTLNNMSPAIVQKMLSQSSGTQGFGGANPTGGRSTLPAQSSQPSTAQLRMLVQQIQMAVQAGYLNHQILNQPLAPQTLVLLNQLLQQIKNLQQLANQQTIAQNQGCLGMKPNNNHILQYNVLITKTKQQISNLQNQIAAQQAMYVKQQHIGSGGPSDLFKSSSMHESINTLQNNFAEIGIKDTQMHYDIIKQSQQQSRLNQWKLPALDKEEGGEFSRAPGSVSKSLAPSHSSPNLNPLGLTQPDGPWSSGRSTDTGWPDTGAGDSGAPDVKDAQWAAPTQPSLTDLVPEFEPGKPWKGTQIKSIEDDPSITPGSVVRSPLSIATIKDNELFNMNPNKSPPLGDTIQPLSLSSSTWSFNPPSSTSTMISSPQNKLPTTKGTLGDLNTPTAVTSELWGAPKPRGPPPGLSAKSSVVNGWATNLGSNSSSSWGGQRNWTPTSGSPWLLLRNLTAQIDGSTLRTLCVQHGPLQSFHLYLHQGFALIKYSSREEATKAQQALNNCVLGNTTILAENPTEWEAGIHLQQVANQQSGSSGTWRGTSKQQVSAADNTWSTGWPNSTSTSLWGSTPLDSGDQSRATPSSLNSFLPGDLLGGESM